MPTLNVEKNRELIGELTEENLEAIRKNLLYLMGEEPSDNLVGEIKRFLETPDFHGKVSAQDFLSQTIRDYYITLDKSAIREDNSDTAAKVILTDVGQSWRIRG